MNDSLQPERSLARRFGPLCALLLVVAALHGAWMAAEPAPTYFEDEPHYSQFAHEDALSGRTSLLPGRLRFDQRPELISRLWAQFVPEMDGSTLTREKVRYDPHLQRSARWVHLPLLLATIVLVFLHARTLGAAPARALGAAALFGLFPWFAFYAHTLWAEVPHAFCVGIAFLCVLRTLRGGARWPLLVAGLALGMALLFKGTMNAFVPVIAAFVGLAPLVQRPEDPWRQRILFGASCAALLFVGTYAVIGPQLLANQEAGHGWRLAGNRWKNLEMGVKLQPRELQTDSERQDRADLHQLYMLAGETYEVREAAAEERLRAHVQETGLATVLAGQARKLTALVFRVPSFFERALTERWGDPAPPWLRALRWPGRVLWTVLVLGGLVGALATFRRSPGHLLLALFVGYYLTAALTIPYKVRFLMPLVPVLAVFTAELPSLWPRRERPTSA